METRKQIAEDFDTKLHRELATSLTAELERLEANRPQKIEDRLPEEKDRDEIFALLEKLGKGFNPEPLPLETPTVDAAVPEDIACSAEQDKRA